MIKKMWVIREIDTKILKVMNKNKFKVKTLSHLGYNKYIIDNHNNYNIKDYEQIPVFVTDEDPFKNVREIKIRDFLSKIQMLANGSGEVKPKELVNILIDIASKLSLDIKNFDEKTK